MMPWRGRGGFSGGGGGGGFRGGPRFGGGGGRGGGGNWQTDNRNTGGFPHFGGPGPSDRFGDSSGSFGNSGPSDRFGHSSGSFGNSGPIDRFGHSSGSFGSSGPSDRFGDPSGSFGDSGYYQSDRYGDSSGPFGGSGSSDRFGESSGTFGVSRFNRGRGGFKRQNRDFARNYSRERNNSETFHQPQSQKWEFKEEDVKPDLGEGGVEDSREYDENLCTLDWYDSDLNCSITPTDFCSVTAMSTRGFGYMWAGARATHGATRGRVCFEVRIDGNQNVAHLENESTPHVIRCGWSLRDTDLQLGEVIHSYGYGGTGKISENCKFQSYGKTFGVGDVIGCYLDMNTDPAIVKFTVNGVDQGVAFRVFKSELGGEALFPHILTKNQDYTVNFGQLPGPMFPLLKGYTPIGQLDTPDGLKRGFRPPERREDCEVLMMIGLPGSGKTYWAEQHKKNNPEKNYNILGTNNLIDKMKVDGLSRKRNYTGRWEELIRQCTECFNKLLELASNRKRNYILDQTNVFPTARGKKMKPFTGFQCKAIVVVPSDHEFKRRVAVREAKEGKEVPDAAVLNMKANFVLPDFEETFFCGVFYTELSPEDTHAIVIQYNAEAISLGQNPTSAVSTFKARNEQQRVEAGVRVPGELLDTSTGNNLSPQVRQGSVKTEKEPGSGRSRKRSRSSDSFGRAKKSNNQENADRRRSRSRERKGRRNSKSRDSRRRSRSRERSRRRSRSRERPEFRKDIDLKWQTQVQSINQQMPSPWLGGGPGSSTSSGNNRPAPFSNLAGADSPSLPNFGVMNERDLATFVSSNPNFLANLGPNIQTCFNMQLGNQNMNMNMGGNMGENMRDTARNDMRDIRDNTRDNMDYQDQDNDVPRKTLLGAPPQNKPFISNKFSKGPNNWGSSAGFDSSSQERAAPNLPSAPQSSFSQQSNKQFDWEETRARAGRKATVDFSKPPPGFGGPQPHSAPSFMETLKPSSSQGGPRNFSNDPNPFMVPGNLVQAPRQYNQTQVSHQSGQGMIHQENRRFGRQNFGQNNFQQDQRKGNNSFKSNQEIRSTDFSQPNFNRNSQADTQNTFNSKYNPMESSQPSQGGRGSATNSFGQEMFQRRERSGQNQYNPNQRQSHGKPDFPGGQQHWDRYQGQDYQDGEYDEFSGQSQDEKQSRPFYGQSQEDRQSRPFYGQSQEDRQSRPFYGQSQEDRQSRPLYGQSQEDRQSRQEIGGGREWSSGNQTKRDKQYFEAGPSSSGRPQVESWGGPREREESQSRRSVENVKSAGDRRMEKELSSGVIKNPFDPSNRIEARPKHNRLNEEFDEPCMNPEAPDPPEASGSTKESAPAETEKTESGAPDYAALLQYLQFYQKQMEDDKKKK